MTTNHFKKAPEAKAYLETLLKKEWFKEQESRKIVERLLANPKTKAMRFRSSANYWIAEESLRERCGRSIE